MLKVLTDLCLSKKTASIYVNNNQPTKFYYGTVLSVSADEIAIDMLLPSGGNDGIVANKVHKVYRVDTDGQYDEKMKKLCTLNTYQPFNGSLDNNNIIQSLLLLALETKKIVSIELLDSGFDDVSGFIEQIEDGQCKIKEIDEYGYEDGYAYVEIKNITQVTYQSEYEKRILNLWNFNKSLW
ncbi:MAG: hypothetical protein K2F81_09505 [Ruminococcus sp.]|nr:hypothetical protein [Ruminococcus sp.]